MLLRGHYGAYVDSNSYTGDIDYTKLHNDFVIGARDNGDYAFDGKIDDMRFYDKVLSAEEVRELYGGYKAFAPNPFNGATGVDPNIVLSWRPGKENYSHDVYLGTDYGDVNDANTSSAEYMGNFDVNSWDPCGLEPMTTYYWRIDEVNDANLWKGNVWSFETVRPEIGLSATQFQFYAVEGGANPDEQILGIFNSGVETLYWTVSCDCNWLSAEPNKGSSTGEVDNVNLSVDISGLAGGIYTCNMVVSDPNASNNPQTAGINLYVRDADGTLYVPSEYSTIQAAIDVALDGNVVIIAPGTYTGDGNRDLDFGGRAITVRSTDPEDPCVVAVTVIDSQNSAGHRGFYFRSGEDGNSVVSGLTIKRGRATGGGIYCSGSSPTINNCVITNNGHYPSGYGANAYGGGVSCTSSSHPVFINCTISDNTAEGERGEFNNNGGKGYGGGIYSDSDSNLTIINCFITGNTARGGPGGNDMYDPGFGGNAYGGGVCLYGSLTIVNCIITENIAKGGQAGVGEGIEGSNGDSFGGGIYCNSVTNPFIRNCTITGNKVFYYSSGAGICNQGSIANITSGIIWNNNGSGEVYGSFDITYSDVNNGYTGTGNIDADPCFIEPSISNYHLHPDSPCVNSGDPNYSPGPGETDIDGELRVMDLRVDMGADEVNDISVPVIEALPVELVFYSYEGSVNPEEQILSICNSGTGTLLWAITEDCNWLSVEPNSGSSTGEFDNVNVIVDINGLAAAIYNCELTVSGNSGNSPETVSVQLYVSRDILYVPSDFVTIQGAIDVAFDGSIVIIEPNVYTGTGNYNLDFGGKAITVRSTNPEDPNVVKATVIDCEGVTGHRGFYFHSGEGPDSVLSGVTIRGGKVRGQPARGGGIYCDGSSPRIKNCIIRSNKAIGSTIDGDGQNAYGGGVCCTNNSHPVLINCSVSSNKAQGGSGGDVWCSSMSGCYGTLGSGGHGYGGGIYSSSDSSVTTVGCIIIDNLAEGGQGGTYYEAGEPIEGRGGGVGIGGGMYYSSVSFIDGCIITMNKSKGGKGGAYISGNNAYGGGIYGDSAIIENCIITNNKTSGSKGADGYSDEAGSGGDSKGGGIYGSNTKIENCIIAKNEAFGGDGGYSTYRPGDGGDADGGGIACGSGAIINNCTITDNTATEGSIGGGGGCCAEPGVSRGDGIKGVATTTIINCILWGNGDDLYGCSATYSCISDTNDSGTGVIHSDPCFVTGPKGGYYLSQTAAGQAADSLCVDTGSDTAANLGMTYKGTRTDEIGDGGIVDMGFHYLLNPADIDGDGDTDFVDFAILAWQWLEAPGEPSADIAPPGGDNIVDGLDLVVIADNWLLTEVTAAPNVPIITATVSHWTFNEGGGDIAYDSVGDNDGILVNVPTWTTGVMSYALSFDGVDDYVDLGNSSSLKPPLPVSISAWIKLSTLDVFNPVLILDAWEPNYCGIIFYIYTDNVLNVHYGDSEGTGPSHRRGKFGTTDLEADEWYHLAVVLRGPTDMDLYIDAVDDTGTYTGEGGDLMYSSGSSYIGYIQIYDSFFNGVIDDVRVYDRALSAEEVEQLYQGGL